MSQRTAIIESLHRLTPENFEENALKVFQYQSEHNFLYRQFMDLLGILPQNVRTLTDIPFLPISFFKNFKIQTELDWQPAAIFTSSGTTTATTARHFIRNLEWYEEITERCFADAYQNPAQYCFLSLLPAYLERTGSSLVHMADHFIRLSKYAQSGFFLNDYQALRERLQICQNQAIPTVLLGVSFALWEFAERFPMDLSGVVIMETGGMKGRRHELIRSELHDLLCKAFQVSVIHSEYGMTELCSQAYSHGNGVFRPSPTMKILIREVTDPLSLERFGKVGGINVIDLANLDSCSFLATEDLGRCFVDGTFEVLGRFDHSDTRGCNLLLEESRSKNNFSN